MIQLGRPATLVRSFPYASARTHPYHTMTTPDEELPRVLLQAGSPLGLPPWIAFRRPLRVISATRLDDVAGALRELEQALTHGRWVAGYISYEAAPAFDPALQVPPAGPWPLLWFGVYEAWQAADPPQQDGPPDGWSGEPTVDADAYASTISRIKELIARGETYQVNYTLRLEGPAPAQPARAFAHLHGAQRGGCSAFIETEDFALCSASPELFFRQQESLLTCQPMKGTAPRGRWPEEDEERVRALQASPKDRAENVMIVDMVRNDLGRIARPGTVRTVSLFDRVRLPTVWQMTSTVTAETDAGLADILRALFPSASVTGAPKVRTMDIIRHLEDRPRGVYTGAIGFAGPGRVAQFNVAIRTLQVDRRAGRAVYGIGSGIVWDSDAGREYEECRSKALVLRPAPDFQIQTTLRWEPGSRYGLLPRHLSRLERAARYFDFAWKPDALQAALARQAASFPASAQRVRLLVARDGTPSVESGPAPEPAAGPRRVALAERPVDTSSPFLYFKTTLRRVYDDVRAGRPDVDDVILWNERGEITESTICNVAVRRDGAWVTPPVACGLLAGVMREELLARGDLQEGVITRAEFQAAPEIALFNAVRGWMKARLDFRAS